MFRKNPKIHDLVIDDMNSLELIEDCAFCGSTLWV
jgi:hypothetical protein